ncbi:MAG: DUF4157 domain-containing protein [Acidobacteria bacterium]|nr:DUF4157 domain-containing protein [Acidobacteriota bacterium]
MSSSERRLFNPGLGLDLARVEIHEGSNADVASRALGAVAYTDQNRVVFRSGAYAPETPTGRRLLAHELTHVGQQRNLRSPDAPAVLQRKEAGGKAAQAGNRTCSISSGQKICCPKERCTRPDKAGGPGRATWWRLSVMFDTDVPTIHEVTATTVGHVYVKFEDSLGNVWSYGLYPKSAIGMAFDRQSAGCMLHPDQIHEACVDYKLSTNLSEKNFSRAIRFAQAACSQPHRFVTTHGGATSPVYTCTTFARSVAAEAGVSLPDGIAIVRSSYMTSRAEWPNVLKSKLIEKGRGEYVGVQLTTVTPAHREFAQGYGRTLAQLTEPDPGKALQIRRFQLTVSVPDLLRTSWRASLRRALAAQARNQKTLGRFEGLEAKANVALIAYLAGAAAALQLADLHIRRHGPAAWKRWALEQRSTAKQQSQTERANRFAKRVIDNLKQGTDPNIEIKRIAQPWRLRRQDGHRPNP